MAQEHEGLRTKAFFPDSPAPRRGGLVIDLDLRPPPAVWGPLDVRLYGDRNTGRRWRSGQHWWRAWQDDGGQERASVGRQSASGGDVPSGDLSMYGQQE